MANYQSKLTSRAGKPKARTGCITCKIRHVKCDEEKPACNNCLRTGRQCDGYAPVKKNKKRSSPSASSSGHSSVLVQWSPSSGFTGDEAECRSFYFFRARTAPQLAGYFASDFWDCLVPLSTHHQPAIKHAVIALGSLHERFENYDISMRGLNLNLDMAQGGFALKQYNRAIGYLIKSVTTGGQEALDTSLVACILFACLETLRGQIGSAISHVQNGVKIISSIKEDLSPQATQSLPLMASAVSCVPLEALEVILARLDSQTTQLVGGPAMPLQFNVQSGQPGFGPHIPASFASLEEAQNSLYYYQNRCLRASYDLDDAALDANPVRPLIESAYLQSYKKSRKMFQEILLRWSSAFDAFLVKASATMDSKALRGAAVLKINHRIHSLNLDYHGQDRFQSSRCWDHLRRECEEIVDLATTVVKLHDQESRESSHKPVFFVDMHIITPLFSIAHRCRDPFIRRKAIALMSSATRQEGLWHSLVTAQVAETIMKIEEAGLGEVKSSADVPEENRISEIEMRFDLHERKGYLKCSRRQPTGQRIYVAEPVVEVFQETLQW